MPIAIKMPALSPTMEEGTLAKWLVKVGDRVSAGDIMAEIETDKATMEFEAVDEGTIADIAVEEGTEGVKVGTVIATLAEEGEDPAEAKKAGGTKQEALAPAPAAAAEEAPTSARAEPVEAPAAAPRPSTSSGRAEVADGDRIIAPAGLWKSLPAGIGRSWGVIPTSPGRLHPTDKCPSPGPCFISAST
jgi:pyruvate dehydrogenase E2 component (dihydrolipoamide acetyltransferase)